MPSSVSSYDHLVLDGDLAKPIVLLDRRVEALNVTSACTDDHAGAKAAVELFLERGHINIGLLLATAAANGPKVSQPQGVVSTVRDRRAGALEALASRNAPSPAIRYSRSNLDESARAATELLTLDPRPTAILATNEEMALGVLSACIELGLTVGVDVSLISFDDSPWAKVFAPAISVVKRPVYDLGSAAVSALIKEIKGESKLGRVELPTELIDRSSVATLT
ncbi:substrate-binding domain-containing protein [Pararhizobium sp. BT-229]|uniref:substrate-binding domain-containing protein n=1 Tax=Pararhizobium sp. BT-229 TaxID=2986923 RepID=UPI0021F6B593|nr:substrate-binding domain-containing protein [Pararhizobium sp. BT-229]MCV9966712.1 substrate-binding domain-containing protein [Pararhizobium sp. BT-229]